MLIQNAVEKKSYSHSFRIASDKSTVSLLESGEQRYIKAIIVVVVVVIIIIVTIIIVVVIIIIVVVIIILFKY